MTKQEQWDLYNTVLNIFQDYLEKSADYYEEYPNRLEEAVVSGAAIHLRSVILRELNTRLDLS